MGEICRCAPSFTAELRALEAIPNFTSALGSLPANSEVFVGVIGALWATSKFCGRAPSFAGELAILLKISEFCEQQTLFLTCELRFSRTNSKFCKLIWNPAADLEVLQANSEFGRQTLSFAGGLQISQPN